MNVPTALIIVAVIAALALALRFLRRNGLDECSSCSRKDGCPSRGDRGVSSGCPQEKKEED